MRETVFGTYAVPGPTSDPISQLRVGFVPLDLVAHWRRCGITADYLANFLAYNFSDRKTATNVLSTVLNELLENAVKFSADKNRAARLVLSHYGATISTEVTNSASDAQTEKLGRFFTRLIEEDPNDLFIEQLEHADRSERSASGVGLITLRKDYGAQVGLTVNETGSAGIYDVSIQVILDAEEVAHR